VFDHGGTHVVKPLGITSFTTLVFDEEGKLIARDRPDRPGYAERMGALVRPEPLGGTDVEQVVSSKHASIRDRCWNQHRELDSAEITVFATIGGDGRVIGATGRGTDAELARCVENEVKRWRFRATGRAAVDVEIPFKLRRDR
jgi:hypothetical protein